MLGDWGAAPSLHVYLYKTTRWRAARYQIFIAYSCDVEAPASDIFILTCIKNSLTLLNPLFTFQHHYLLLSLGRLTILLDCTLNWNCCIIFNTCLLKGWYTLYSLNRIVWETTIFYFWLVGHSPFKWFQSWRNQNSVMFLNFSYVINETRRQENSWYCE